MTELERWKRAYRRASVKVCRAYGEELRCRRAVKRVKSIRHRNGKLARGIIKEFARRGALLLIDAIEKAYNRVHGWFMSWGTDSFDMNENGLALYKGQGK